MKMRVFAAIILVIIIFSFVNSPFSENKGENNFQEYLELFPKKGLPFKALWDYDASTPFEVPLNKIPKPLYEQFICSYNIKCKPDYCTKDKFFGFNALGRFNVSDSIELLLVTLNTDAGCDEKWYLITYTSKGKVIDKVVVYGKTYTKLPTDEDPSKTYLQYEGIIGPDCVTIHKTEITYNEIGERETTATIKYKLKGTGEFKVLEN